MAVIESAEMLLQARTYSGSGNWLDDSGNGHDAVPTGAIAWDGEKFTLDANEYWTVANAAGLNFGVGEDLTVVAVVTSDSLAAAAVVADKGPIAGGGNFGWGIFVVATSGRVTFQTRDTANTARFVTSNPADVVTVGQRAVLAGVRDASTSLSVYVDGAETSAALTNLDITSAFDLIIGGLATAPTALDFIGDVYAVGLWREILTTEQIATAADEMLFGVPDTGRCCGGSTKRRCCKRRGARV